MLLRSVLKADASSSASGGSTGGRRMLDTLRFPLWQQSPLALLQRIWDSLRDGVGETQRGEAGLLLHTETVNISSSFFRPSPGPTNCPEHCPPPRLSLKLYFDMYPSFSKTNDNSVLLDHFYSLHFYIRKVIRIVFNFLSGRGVIG